MSWAGARRARAGRPSCSAWAISTRPPAAHHIALPQLTSPALLAADGCQAYSCRTAVPPTANPAASFDISALTISASRSHSGTTRDLWQPTATLDQVPMQMLHHGIASASQVLQALSGHCISRSGSGGFIQASYQPFSQWKLCPGIASAGPAVEAPAGPCAPGRRCAGWSRPGGAARSPACSRSGPRALPLPPAVLQQLTRW